MRKYGSAEVTISYGSECAEMFAEVIENMYKLNVKAARPVPDVEMFTVSVELFTTVRGEGAARRVQRGAVVSKRVGCYGLRCSA